MVELMKITTECSKGNAFSRWFAKRNLPKLASLRDTTKFNKFFGETPDIMARDNTTEFSKNWCQESNGVQGQRALMQLSYEFGPTMSWGFVDSQNWDKTDH